jgi:hypothetical protein
VCNLWRQGSDATAFLLKRNGHLGKRQKIVGYSMFLLAGDDSSLTAVDEKLPPNAYEH